MTDRQDRSRRPRVAVSMGDAAGVGPELCLQILTHPEVLDACIPIVFGDADVLYRVADIDTLDPPAQVVSPADWQAMDDAPTEPLTVDCNALVGARVQPGDVDAACGRAAHRYVLEAVRSAIDGRVDAICTAPINKAALDKAGLRYPGHTEMLAEATGAADVRMMFASDTMVITLETIHLPYRDVPTQLRTDCIRQTIAMTRDALVQMGRPNPRIIVCGLNPHAAEGGLFGSEESTIIRPAVEAAHHNGIDVHGPIPPDTAFRKEVRDRTDGYVAMYHDQGLIPFKMLAFDHGVNVTLGLPIIRTSPDHGTAFDIAWKHVASPTSMVRAMCLAARLARARRR